MNDIKEAIKDSDIIILATITVISIISGCLTTVKEICY